MDPSSLHTPSQAPAILGPAGNETPAARQHAAFAAFQTARQAHWDEVADRLAAWRGMGGYYHRRLARVLKFLVPPGLRVLEVGCGDGQLLASTRPAFGLGVDFSTHMIGTASWTHP